MLVSDLRSLAPFTFGLVAVPTAIGTLIGIATRRRPG